MMILSKYTHSRKHRVEEKHICFKNYSDCCSLSLTFTVLSYSINECIYEDFLVLYMPENNHSFKSDLYLLILLAFSTERSQSQNDLSECLVLQLMNGC